MGFFSLKDSGIIIIKACGSDRPVNTNNSKTLSKLAESLFPGSTTGNRLESDVIRGVCIKDSCAAIHALFPLMVLISPLCAIMRNGCASSHAGNVLVLNRE
jgi:hypothetical protein